MTAPRIDWEKLGKLARRKLDRPAGPLGGSALSAETGLAKGHLHALARGGKMPALAYLRACDFVGVDPVTLAPLAGSSLPGRAPRSSPLAAPIPPLGAEILWPIVGMALIGNRLLAGLSVRDAAKAIGISVATVSIAERGVKVDAQSLLRICAWLKRHPHEVTSRGGTAGAGSSAAPAEVGSNEINALECGFPVKQSDAEPVKHGGGS